MSVTPPRHGMGLGPKRCIHCDVIITLYLFLCFIKIAYQFFHSHLISNITLENPIDYVSLAPVIFMYFTEYVIIFCYVFFYIF